ncbi:MAG: hypothetical protein ABWX70_14445 [Hyphomicrobium sp.]
MTYSRYLAALAFSAAIVVAGTGPSIAQSLSDASSAYSSPKGGGYMGLGGNLGNAIMRRHKTRPAKIANSARAERKAAPRYHSAKAVTYNPGSDATIFLIARALDQSGLNINSQRGGTAAR